MSRHDHDVRAATPALERARNRDHARRRQHAQVTGVPPSLDVHVDDLAEGELEVDTVLPAATLSELLDEGKEIEWTATGDAKVALRLEREAGFVRVRGRASFALRHPCVRCLSPVPFDVPLDVDLRLVRKDAAEAKAPEADHGDDDLEEAGASGDLDDIGIASFAGDTIHLAEVLREQLFLELPMHPACDSPRARPTAPCAYDEGGALKAEQERWVDPRWAGLAKLKDQLAGGKAPAAKPAAKQAEVVALPGRQTPVALPGRTAQGGGARATKTAPPTPAPATSSAPKTAAAPARPEPTRAPAAKAAAPAKPTTNAAAKAAKKPAAKAAKKPATKAAKKPATKAAKKPAAKAAKKPATKAAKKPATKAAKKPATKAAKKAPKKPRARR